MSGSIIRDRREMPSEAPHRALSAMARGLLDAYLIRARRPTQIGAKSRGPISVPLTPVTRGLSWTLADSPSRRSDDVGARTVQIPKLIACF